jgi:germacradienol/geosmin synthase
VIKLMTARTTEFEHIAADDLPAMFVELDLDDDIRQVLTTHADQLKDWMAGILACIGTPPGIPEDELHVRYRPAAAPVARADFSFHPTGLGTSAFRLASALAKVDRAEASAP